MNVRSSLMAVNIHITIIELNALHTKRQNLFQELDAVIHLLMEAKHWGLRKSRNATSLNRSEERFSRNAETDLVCRLLLEKKKRDDGELSAMQKVYSALKSLPPDGQQRVVDDVCKRLSLSTEQFRDRISSPYERRQDVADPTEIPPARDSDAIADLDSGDDSDGIFFFNDTSTTDIYTLSLHDALPI